MTFPNILTKINNYYFMTNGGRWCQAPILKHFVVILLTKYRKYRLVLIYWHYLSLTGIYVYCNEVNCLKSLKPKKGKEDKTYKKLTRFGAWFLVIKLIDSLMDIAINLANYLYALNNNLW
jgi:hypothetical protein